MNMRLAYLLFIFSLIVAGYVGIYWKEEPPTTFRDSPATPAATNDESASQPSGEDRSPASGRPTAKPGAALDPGGLDEQSFRVKYGDHLRWVRARNGEVVAIRAKTDRLEEWEKNQRAQGPYNSRNREQVLKRAEEILQDARDILQLDPRFPLEHPRFSQTDFSAQVSFDESFDGTPLSQGKVSLLLGPAGELRALDSDYIHGLRVPERAPATASTPGRAILWVDRRTEGDASARYAREVRESGTQTVRDANSGEVIYHRDRRTH